MEHLAASKHMISISMMTTLAMMLINYDNDNDDDDWLVCRKCIPVKPSCGPRKQSTQGKSTYKAPLKKATKSPIKTQVETQLNTVNNQRNVTYKAPLERQPNPR